MLNLVRIGVSRLGNVVKKAGRQSTHRRSVVFRAWMHAKGVPVRWRSCLRFPADKEAPNPGVA